MLWLVQNMSPLQLIGTEMQRLQMKILKVLVLVVVVVGINAILFSLFPLLHHLFGQAVYQTMAPLQRLTTVVEFHKPEKKETAPRMRNVRRVANRQRASSSSSLQFKFSPDLAVEGTGTVAMEQTELAPAFFEEGQTDVPAVPLYKPAIAYPNRARELEVEGTLEVIIIIDTKGKVSSIDVVRSPHSSITIAARAIIATWRFKPAQNKGIPVRVRVRQVIDFSLD